jgi:phosphate/sulfate permease
MPVSTTHAITASVVLVGAVALGTSQVVWSSLFGKIVVPLLLSPIIAFGMGVTLLAIHQIRDTRTQLLTFLAVAASMGAGSLLGGRAVTHTLANESPSSITRAARGRGGYGRARHRHQHASQ